MDRCLADSGEEYANVQGGRRNQRYNGFPNQIPMNHIPYLPTYETRPVGSSTVPSTENLSQQISSFADWELVDVLVTQQEPLATTSGPTDSNSTDLDDIPMLTMPFNDEDPEPEWSIRAFNERSRDQPTPTSPPTVHTEPEHSPWNTSFEYPLPRGGSSSYELPPWTAEEPSGSSSWSRFSPEILRNIGLSPTSDQATVQSEPPTFDSPSSPEEAVTTAGQALTSFIARLEHTYQWNTNQELSAVYNQRNGSRATDYMLRPRPLPQRPPARSSRRRPVPRSPTIRMRRARSPSVEIPEPGQNPRITHSSGDSESEGAVGLPVPAAAIPTRQTVLQSLREQSMASGVYISLRHGSVRDQALAAPSIQPRRYGARMTTQTSQTTATTVPVAPLDLSGPVDTLNSSSRKKITPKVKQAMEKIGVDVGQPRTSRAMTPDSCSICLELPSPTAASLTFPCLHTFCNECISVWVQTKSSCPNCQASVTRILFNLRGEDDYDVKGVEDRNQLVSAPPFNGEFFEIFFHLHRARTEHIRRTGEAALPTTAHGGRRIGDISNPYPVVPITAAYQVGQVFERSWQDIPQALAQEIIFPVGYEVCRVSFRRRVYVEGLTSRNSESRSFATPVEIGPQHLAVQGFTARLQPWLRREILAVMIPEATNTQREHMLQSVLTVMRVQVATRTTFVENTRRFVRHEDRLLKFWEQMAQFLHAKASMGVWDLRMTYSDSRGPVAESVNRASIADSTPYVPQALLPLPRLVDVPPRPTRSRYYPDSDDSGDSIQFLGHSVLPSTSELSRPSIVDRIPTPRRRPPVIVISDSGSDSDNISMLATTSQRSSDLTDADSMTVDRHSEMDWSDDALPVSNQGEEARRSMSVSASVSAPLLTSVADGTRISGRYSTIRFDERQRRARLQRERSRRIVHHDRSRSSMRRYQDRTRREDAPVHRFRSGSFQRAAGISRSPRRRARRVELPDGVHGSSSSRSEL